MDQIAPERRSALMARIKGKNTGPELRARKVAHAMGLRFRLHRAGLPGKPDLVFPRWRIALFVHGCFWHQHAGCPRASFPKSRTEYWERKLRKNVERDPLVFAALKALGWRVVVIWECETNDPGYLARMLRKYFSGCSRPNRSRLVR
ncbi:MAG: very short patch repair endonuclease [Methylocella sp.]